MENYFPVVLCNHTTAVSVHGQCDACAPIAATTPVASAPSTGALYAASPFLTEHPITQIHTLCYAITSPTFHNLTMLNLPAASVLHHFRQPHLLHDTPVAWNEAWGKEVVQFTLQQMVTLGLLVPEGYVAPAFTENPTTLAAWLHITEECNLACAYCYLPLRYAEMSPQIGRAAVEAIFRSALSYGYNAIKLKYAGGEPLLRFPLVTDLHRQARAVAERHGLALEGVILSNGTLLTAEIAQTILALDLQLTISLDGLGMYHDCQRHFPNGRGSFRAVTRAIELALSYGLTPNISITVSGRNASGLAELLAWVLERDLPFSLNFYRENGRSASHNDLQLEEKRIIEGMLAAYKVVEENLPRHSLLAALADRANLAVPHLRPCSVGHSYLVFDSQGHVAKCQMEINHKVASVHDPNPLALVRESANGVQNPPVGEKEECSQCQWRYWCAGGCPLMAHRTVGRYEARSPNCNIYKVLYPEIIRLEGLRLLKNHHLLV